MNTAPSKPSPHPPPQERLLPLLYRYASESYYRRSPRFARHRVRVGAPATLPVPPLTDRLAVHFSQRMPTWFVARYGSVGLFRAAKLLAGALGGLGLAVKPAVFIAKLAWRGLKRTPHSPVADPHYVRRAPVGNTAVVLGDSVRFRGFTYGDDRLYCYFARIKSAGNPCRILVRIFPEFPDRLLSPGKSASYFSRDHDPVHPLPAWPRGYAYCTGVSFADLPPGDYRVEIGLLDLVSNEPLLSSETGRSMIDLGWVRVAGSPPKTPTPVPAGVVHAEA
jgi:hypothetical protein